MRQLNRVIVASALAVPMALAASGIAVAADAEDGSGVQNGPVGDLLEGTPLEGSSFGSDDSQSLESLLKVVGDLENADEDDLVQIGKGNSGPMR